MTSLVNMTAILSILLKELHDIRFQMDDRMTKEFAIDVLKIPELF
jgi:hypothetical protein